MPVPGGRGRKRRPTRGSSDGKSVPMSPMFAAPSSASISACVTTSPSEWPARPPPREVDAAEHERLRAAERVRVDADADPQLRHRRTPSGSSSSELDLQRRLLRPALEIAPRAAADVHGDHPAAARGHDVVVDPVAHVGDLAGLGVDRLEQQLEEARRGLLGAERVRRRREVHVEPEALDERLQLAAHVPGEAHEVAAGREPAQARLGVVVEIGPSKPTPSGRSTPMSSQARQCARRGRRPPRALPRSRAPRRRPLAASSPTSAPR